VTAVSHSIEPIVGGGVTSAAGFRAGAARAEVKDGTNRLDLAVVVADAPCAAAAVFTQCAVVAAPVILCRERIASGSAQAIVLNSGNANACTGAEGMNAAQRMGDVAAQHVGIDPSLMLVSSTGVIGVQLPIDRICQAIPKVDPTTDGGHDAALAIMTTDTVPKEAAVAVEIGGARITVGGMAKGSGMIHPNMATMLAVITTDAKLDPALARSALTQAVNRSFNQVSVDGDTSTNDMVALFASAAAGGPELREGAADARLFVEALETVCVDLARKIARDGEGATRLIEVTVTGAASETDAARVARSVASSQLLKAAVYGRDPNWGRIVSAVGNAGVRVDPDAIDVTIGAHQVAANGMGIPFDHAAVSDAMGADEVQIGVDLHLGSETGRAWGCDLTEGYVKINAEYTT
jgi:glutamate N-acetyltransferase / amino-acid N-acetyltransferase